ncbi:glycosyltransferase family 4 protein [Alkalibacterium kapii]|uniref:Glycosyl transferase n=1 Tax=Alkalibacterium kapii TaxID=426704 RepID=A0A511AY09_9LACT|nr:glycosyltransferase family 4 protein [Alkalibacterium kapii]GEK90497.1 glycosyl transferase [Alkalibacterium kapii]
MKTFFLNAGNETGGGRVHIVSLLKELKNQQIDLIVFEEGPVAKAARQENINVYVFEQKSQFDLSVLFRLKRFIEKQGYSLVHTHGPRANTLFAFLKPFVKLKWIITLHSHPLMDFNNQGLKGKVFESIHIRTFNKADGVIAVSNEIKSYIQSRDVDSDQIKVIHNGILFPESPSRPNSGKTQLFTLVTVGRLTEIKGNTLLMDVLATFDKSNWRWMVCGDGEDLNSLSRKAAEYGLEHQIQFKGWLSAGEIKKVLAQADVFVLPSLSETFPLSLLEAASQKVPAIASNVGDVNKIIKDKSMGWLVAPNDRYALKRALEDAYHSWEKDELRFKGKQLYKHAEMFTLKKQAQSVLAFYKKILTEPPK